MAKLVQPQRSSGQPLGNSTQEILARRQKVLWAVKGIALVLGLLLLWALWSLIQFGIATYWLGRVQTVYVSSSDFVVSSMVDGILLRDEYLTLSTDDGNIMYDVAEGAQVAAGALIVHYDSSTMLHSVELQMIDIQETLNTYDGETTVRIRQLQERVAENAGTLRAKTSALRDAIQAFDQGKITALEADIAKINAERLQDEALLLQLPEDPDVLRERLARLQDQHENADANVYALRDGVISFWIDGQEDDFGLNGFKRISRDMLQSLPESTYLVREGMSSVQRASPLFKTVEPTAWRWTGYIPIDQWQHPADGLVSFYYRADEQRKFDALTDVPATSERIVSWLVDSVEEGGYQRITVEFPQLIPSTLPHRLLKLAFIVRETSGIVLTNDNVLQIGGQDGVLVVEGGFISFRAISIADRDNNRILLRDFPAGEVVVNPAQQMIGLRLR